MSEIDFEIENTFTRDPPSPPGPLDPPRPPPRTPRWPVSLTKDGRASEILGFDSSQQNESQTG